MRKAAMILGLIGGLLGLVGGFCTAGLAGCGSAISQADKSFEKSGLSDGKTRINEDDIKTVAGLATVGIFGSLAAIIFGVIAGVAKSSKAVLIFSILLILAGIGTFVSSNYLSAPLIVVGGILGVIGSFQKESFVAPN